MAKVSTTYSVIGHLHPPCRYRCPYCGEEQHIDKIRHVDLHETVGGCGSRKAALYLGARLNPDMP